MTQPKPLFTIAIPTWNRGQLLKKSLEQLQLELVHTEAGQVEILVSDNASSDDTQLIVQRLIKDGLSITSIRNEVNVGSDANIAACFNKASGKYVLILGDDDLFVDHSLSKVLSILCAKEYGVVYLRAYGFEQDFRKEFPGKYGTNREYTDNADYLVRLSSRMTFISSCIINRDLLPDVNANEYCGSNLVQVELVLQAALAAKQNYYVGEYIIACFRNNSSGYDYSTVFVNNLCSILDKYQSERFSATAVRCIENNMLLAFYPYHLTMQRINNPEIDKTTLDNFNRRFHGHRFFSIFVLPILNLPRPLAIFWGAIMMFVGRSLNGDLNRVFYFGWHKIKKQFKKLN